MPHYQHKEGLFFGLILLLAKVPYVVKAAKLEQRQDDSFAPKTARWAMLLMTAINLFAPMVGVDGREPMSQPKRIALPRILLLALFGLSFTAYEDSVIAAEGAGSFYEQLESLSSGYKELSYAATQEFEATAYDPREGLAGVKLGMSMEDVIGVWGKPKKICMQASVTLLSIGRGSQFSFKENELVTIKIHSADLPSMKLSNDVDFSFSPSQLGSLYETRNTRANTYTTDVAEGIELQFHYYNPGNKGPKMVTIAIVRRP